MASAAVLVVGLVALVPVRQPERAGAAGSAVFDPIPGAQSLGPSAFGQVEATGDGTFVQASRVQLPIGQFISMRTSLDGGRTWRSTALLAGDAGGATRPRLSVSGSFAAVGFIGSWCLPDQPSVCPEAPYLSVSTDAGASWSEPRRLDREAFEVKVAQGGSRTWVAWQARDTVRLRGTTDGGATWFADREQTGYLAGIGADTEVAAMVFSQRLVVGTEQRFAALSLSARGNVVAPSAVPIEDPAGPLALAPLGVAVADGRINVLARTAPHEAGTAPDALEVRSADADGVFDAASVIGFDTSGASIDAAHDLVAVSVTSPESQTVSVATSNDGGRTFGAITPVAVGLDAQWSRVGVARRPTDRPTARFAWSVPATLVDDDGDGWVDPANDKGDPTTDADRVASGERQQVTFDACRATTAPRGRTITSYRWSSVGDDGAVTTLPASGCRFSRTMVSGERTKVRLEVTDDAGSVASTVQLVAPRNLLVASIGDGVASGEGNPHQPVDGNAPAVWQDRPCHRSVIAGPAQAARRLEDADPHTSVTFVQLACSGASIVDVPLVDGTDRADSGGVLDQYQGREPAAGSLRPSQLSQLDALRGGRDVDALLVSVGADDVQLSEVVRACILSNPLTPCNETSVGTGLEARLATLPDRYARLAGAIDDAGIAADDVYLTEYFDPTTDELGVVQMRCAVTDGAVELLTDDEARWARSRVLGGLNGAALDASIAHGWRLISGISAAFARHGYCSSDPWVVTYEESNEAQGSSAGSFQPNPRGHQAYGDAIFRSIQRATTPLPSQQDVTQRPALGDVVVMSGGNTAMYATSVRDTGGAPVVLGTRRVDRVLSGDGLLGMVGRPAVDQFAAAAAWTTIPTSGSTAAEDFVARVAVRPNAAVRSVSVVQAPTGGRYLVSGRNTIVYAQVDANIDQNETVTVDVNVQALPADPDDPGDPGRPVLATSNEVTLRPGLNRLYLPTDQTFELLPLERVKATVTVADPIGADEADAIDNERSTDPAIPKQALETRSLRVQFIAPFVEGAEAVECSTLAGVARVQTRYARLALPVVQDGIEPSVACTPFSEMPANEPEITAYLRFLDGIARTIGVDTMVAVVPKGWLQRATKGAVGASVAGVRAVVIETGSESMTMSHEIAHSFGELHKPARQVDGVSVDERRYRSGTDWMAERVPERYWTGPDVWDGLASRIGPPGGIPDPPEPLDEQLDITGTITEDDRHIPGRWTPATGTDLDLEDLQLERLQARQLDGSGNEVDADPIGLYPADGVWAPDATPGGPFGSVYVGRITVAPTTATIQIVRDGTVIDERPVTPAPTVTVTSPAAGEELERGSSVTVEWTTSDPSLLADVLVSQDGGTTWKPLATDVTGTSATVDLPLDLVDGDAVLRVVQRTGTNLGYGDSGTVTIVGGSATIPERIVAVRADLIDLTVPGATLPSVPGNGLVTMAPDGTDLVQIVDTVAPGPGQPGFVPLRPTWSPDASKIAFDAASGGRRDLYVVDRDGSDLRRLTDATSSEGRELICADWSPDGTTLVGWRTAGTGNPLTALQLVEVDVATGAVTPRNWTTQNFVTEITDISCPRWGTDGGEIFAQRQTGGGSFPEHDTYVLDATTLASKYQFGVNNGALQSDALYMRWLNPAPDDTDRFVTSGVLFRSSELYVNQPTDTMLFIGDEVVIKPLPKIWQRLISNATTPPSSPRGLGSVTFGSIGFTPDGDKVWATTRSNLTPTRTERLVANGTVRQVITDPVGHLCTFDIGTDPQVVPPTECYAAGGDGLPVTTVEGAANVPPEPLPDLPTTGIAMADWSAAITDGPSNEAVVIEDPNTVPPPPEDPPPGDVEEPTPPAEPAPDADQLPPTGPATVPVDGTFELVAGEERTVELPASDDGLAPFELADLPGPGTVGVAPTGTGADPTTTDLDHRVRLRAEGTFTGTVTFQVRRGDVTATITVIVTPAPRPTAVDDEIVVDAGEPTTIEGATLLANDEPAGGATPVAAATDDALRIVSVNGFDGGVAVLDRDGTIDVLATASGTFRYVIADASGRTDEGTVQVRLTGSTTTTQPTGSTTTQPNATTTTASTTPASTTTTTGGSATTATTDPPPGGVDGTGGPGNGSDPDGAIARTGGDPRPLVSIGLAAVAAGAIILALRRRAARST